MEVPLLCEQQKRLANGKQVREDKERRWRTKQQQAILLQQQHNDSHRETDDSNASDIDRDLLERSPRSWETAAAAPQPSPATANIQRRTASSMMAEEWACRQDHAHFATLEHVRELRQQGREAIGGDAPTGVNPITRILAPYADLKDSNLVIRHSLFVAEGTETVRLLLLADLSEDDYDDDEDDDRIDILSIVCKPSVLVDPPVSLVTCVEAAWEARRDNQRQRRRSPFSVVVADQSVQNDLTGYAGCRGAMACGRVPAHRDENWLICRLLPRRSERNSGRLRLLALDGVGDSANLGSAIRTASAFGLDAIVLSRNSCDAWYRRSVRVSMGHIFRVPTVRVYDLASTLRKLRETFNVASYAAVVSESDLILERLERGTYP
jgi:hypothetical protein